MKTKKLTCKEITKHICEELDEHINTVKCREIKKHLAACPNCTAYLNSLRKTVKLYRAYPNPKLSEKCRRELFTVLKIYKTIKPL
jgi:predicted anti-sigma-YlaC factor YlaD